MTGSSRAVGVLGGAFDPVHFGHLRPALEIQQQLGLQEVRLVPCRIPPHRPQPQASAAQRVAMLEAAIRRHPGLRIDTRELDRAGPSWTLDTLVSLHEEHGGQGTCLLLVHFAGENDKLLGRRPPGFEVARVAGDGVA